MRIFPILLLFIISAVSFSQEPECSSRIAREDVQKIVEETRSAFFPELVDTNISIKEFTSDAYFLQAKPAIKSLLGKRNNRKYFIEVNTALYRCPPSLSALEAIISHELEHVSDYEKMSALEIAGLGIRYATSKKWRALYERGTDRKVVEKGLARGLSDYRYWIYPKLSPRELNLKRYYYLTPEEMGY